ncbi:MAG: HAD family phosphatase [Planctomycetes bacterium]|nr:HAD family phosphatase [Planctomycetota bacterium]
MPLKSRCGYDLVAVDLDGTLFDRDGHISKRNLAAVARAREAGVHVVVCTGRSLSEAAGSLDPLQIDGPVITAGGAMTVDAVSGRTMLRADMPDELVVRLTRFLCGRSDHAVLLLKDRFETGVDYLVVGDGLLDPASEWWFANMPVVVERVGEIGDDPYAGHTVRVGLVKPARAMAGVVRELGTVFGNEVFLHHFPALKGAEDGPGRLDQSVHLLEVFSPETNKWSAVAGLAGQYGIPTSRVAAIGDEHNDLAMIDGAGLGIAMGNAIESIKHAAQRVTDDNEHDGVATALERILSGEW